MPDYTKGTIVLNTIIAMFSQYSSTPFSVEPMNVIYPKGPTHPKFAGQTLQLPDLSPYDVTAKVDYIQKAIGLSAEQLPASTIPKLLNKMMLDAKLDAASSEITVSVPITRPDIMHACDVMEDVAVAYSFNKIPREPAPVRCTGMQQPISRLTDLMRLELAQASRAPRLRCCTTRPSKRCGGKMTRLRCRDRQPKDDRVQVRYVLLPGLFKTLANKQNPLPWRLFEVSDTAHIDGRGRGRLQTSPSGGRPFGLVHFRPRSCGLADSPRNAWACQERLRRAQG